MKVSYKGNEYRINWSKQYQKLMNPENQIVVTEQVTGTYCFIKNEANEVIADGNSFLNPADNFNKNIGRKISLTRALSTISDKDFRSEIWKEYFIMRNGKN